MERAHRDDVKLAPALEESVAEHEHTTRERYVEGAPPGVGAAGGAHGQTASMLAFEDDANTRELKAKVGALVSKSFGGDYKAAFEAYGGKDGKVAADELKKLLADAGVGNGITRGAWVSGIIEKLDGDGDGKVSWTEFEAVVNRASA